MKTQNFKTQDTREEGGTGILPVSTKTIPAMERIDCGSGHHFGVCPKCKRGHGIKIEISPPLAKAMRSLRVVAHLNIRQARDAKKQNRPRMAAYHLQVALDCRRDANALR